MGTGTSKGEGGLFSLGSQGVSEAVVLELGMGESSQAHLVTQHRPMWLECGADHHSSASVCEPVLTLEEHVVQ